MLSTQSSNPRPPTPQPTQPSQQTSSPKPKVTVTDAVRLSGQFYYVNSGIPVVINDLEIFAFYYPTNPTNSPGVIIPYDPAIGGFTLPPSDMVFGFRKRNVKPEMWVNLSDKGVAIEGNAKWAQASEGQHNLQITK